MIKKLSLLSITLLLVSCSGSDFKVSVKGVETHTGILSNTQSVASYTGVDVDVTDEFTIPEDSQYVFVEVSVSKKKLEENKNFSQEELILYDDRDESYKPIDFQDWLTKLGKEAFPMNKIRFGEFSGIIVYDIPAEVTPVKITYNNKTFSF